MPRDLLRQVAKQILVGLKHLIDIKIIHCDLKPENILFTDKGHNAVRLIDFGSACTDYKNGFTYVMSRYYRAPEVALGIPYTHAIDMWSFGLIIYEMARVHPLYPARDEKDLIEMLRVTLGKPSLRMLERAKKLK